MVSKNKRPKGRTWYYPSQIKFEKMKEGDRVTLYDGTRLKAITGEVDKEDPLCGVYCRNGTYECFFLFKPNLKPACENCEIAWRYHSNYLVLVKDEG